MQAKPQYSLKRYQSLTNHIFLTMPQLQQQQDSLTRSLPEQLKKQGQNLVHLWLSYYTFIHKMDCQSIALQQQNRRDDRVSLKLLDSTLAYVQYGVQQSEVNLQGLQNNAENVLDQFEQERTIYERQDCKVMLLRRKESKEMLIAKVTQNESKNDSTSIHLGYEIQFYKKMGATSVSHLAKISDVFANQNKCVRLMEYACRGDLTYYLPSTSHITTKDEKIQHISAVKNIIYQVVQGLEEIHKLGYVYRDLKPANILINHSGKIKLCDFGLVAPLGVIDSSVCGTPQYMPPERLSNKRNTTPTDASIDLWALGVLAFQLLMGYTPYEYDGEELDSLLENIYGGYISFDSSLPNQCRHFVFNLLQTNPNRRMSLAKVKQHAFLQAVQQQQLQGSGCKCSLRKSRS